MLKGIGFDLVGLKTYLKQSGQTQQIVELYTKKIPHTGDTEYLYWCG